MQALGCILTLILVLAIVAGIDALIALVIYWALNSFTQLHPTYMTIFVVLVLISLFFGSVKGTISKE